MVMLVPFKPFVIETTLSTDHVFHTFEQITQVSKPFIPNLFSRERRYFLGNVDKKGFKVIRNISYLNSFLPEIKGAFEPSISGTNVKITMIGNPIIIVALVAAFAFFAFSLMVYLPIELVSKFWMLFGVLGGGGIGYLIYIVAFSVNMTIDKNYLMALFANHLVGI